MENGGVKRYVFLYGRFELILGKFREVVIDVFNIYDDCGCGGSWRVFRVDGVNTEAILRYRFFIIYFIRSNFFCVGIYRKISFSIFVEFVLNFGIFIKVIVSSYDLNDVIFWIVIFWNFSFIFGLRKFGILVVFIRDLYTEIGIII